MKPTKSAVDAEVTYCGMHARAGRYRELMMNSRVGSLVPARCSARGVVYDRSIVLRSQKRRMNSDTKASPVAEVPAGMEVEARLLTALAEVPTVKWVTMRPASANHSWIAVITLGGGTALGAVFARRGVSGVGAVARKTHSSKGTGWR